MDLAPRDMVSRAIYQEIRAGRGIGGKDYVYLDLTPPRPEGHRREAARHHRVRPRLPGHRADHRAGADPADGALRDGRHPDRPRLARGHRRRRGPSCPACTRPASAPASASTAPTGLGTNSLVDILVFGRRAGRPMAEDVSAARIRRAADCRRRGRRSAPRSRRCGRDRRGENAGAHPQGARRRDDGQRAASTATTTLLTDGPGQGPRAAGPLRQGRRRRQGQGLQHGPARGARGRLPARLRRGDRRRGAGPQGEPRRPRPRGLPGARRRRLPDATRSRPRPRAARHSRTSR